MSEKVNFDEFDNELYSSFIELGWIIPQNEEDVLLAENSARRKKVPPLPEKLRDPSALISKLRQEQNLGTLKIETAPFKGIFASARELKISIIQLAKMTELSTILLAQFEHGLIKVNEKLPQEIVSRIAAAINSTTEQVLEYINGPRFAQNQNFKAEDAPVLTDALDFPDAVIQDEKLDHKQKEKLLALIKDT